MIPATMKAVVTRGYGGLDQLDYTDVPVPKPLDDEVLVKVAACGLNNTDVWTREGRYGTAEDPSAKTGPGGLKTPFPLIQGADIVGEIVATGSQVPTARIGERVIVNLAVYGEGGYGAGYIAAIGAHRPGGYAEYCALPAACAYPVKSALSDAELATFACAYSTAEHMLSRARVGAGDLILILGASGGVGSALVQLAKLRGAEVIAVTSRRKLDRVRSLSPKAVVAHDDGSLIETVRQASGRQSVDAVLDVVGGRYFPQVMALIGLRGRYVTAGAIDGPLVQLDLRTIYLKQLEMGGVSLGRPQDFDALIGHIEAGRLRPLLHKTFRLSEIREAQTEFLEKEFFGKLVVLP